MRSTHSFLGFFVVCHHCVLQPRFFFGSKIRMGVGTNKFPPSDPTPSWPLPFAPHATNDPPSNSMNVVFNPPTHEIHPFVLGVFCGLSSLRLAATLFLRLQDTNGRRNQQIPPLRPNTKLATSIRSARHQRP